MEDKYSNYKEYIRRCHELAVSAGKSGYDTFGALIVHDGRILAEATNTADYDKGIFGHAEFNLVHKCANKYSDRVLADSVFYTSCAPCPRCLMAILSLGITNIVYSVSYDAFARLLPFAATTPDFGGIAEQMNIKLTMVGPVLEDEGMRVFEYWGGKYRPLEELLSEAEMLRNEQ